MLFLLPLARRLAGDPYPLPLFEKAVLAEGLSASGERDEYLRGHFDGDVVRVLSLQDSAGLLALSQANCLLLRRAGQPPVDAGGRIDMLRFR